LSRRTGRSHSVLRSISSLLSPPVAESSRDGDGEESAEQQLSGHGMFNGKQQSPMGTTLYY
jgi:hypothetical protein